MIAPGAARTVQGGVNFRDLGSAANLLRKGAVYRCSQIFRSQRSLELESICLTAFGLRTLVLMGCVVWQLCGAAAAPHKGWCKPFHSCSACPHRQYNFLCADI